MEADGPIVEASIGLDAWGPPDPSALLACLPDPVLVINQVGTLTWANQRAEEEFGISLAEGVHRSMLDFVHPDDLVTAASSLESVQLKAVGTPIEVRVRDRSGAWARYEARGWSGLHDPHVRGVVTVLRRVEDRGRWGVSGGDTARLAAVLDWSPGLTMLLDRKGRVLTASRFYSSCLGLPLEATLGRPLVDLVVDPDAEVVRSVLDDLLASGGSRSFEATFLAAPDRAPTPFGLTAVNLLEDADVHAILVSGVDIASLVANRAELTHRATHDPLTGLPNRVLVLEQLERVLRTSVGTTACVGLVYCDIDGFKAINDAHGHGVGDDVLVEVADRMRACLRPDDTAGRIGGDEMVVIALRDTVEEVEAVADALVETVARPISTSIGPVALTLSAGHAVARGGARADELLQRADAAMYARKRANAGLA